MRNILYQMIREEDKHLLNQKGVYQIKNKENNKVYIGSTSLKFYKRLTAHIKELIENRHHSKHLQNTFNQTKNFDKFEVSILEICAPEKCLESEQKWIDFYQSYNDKFGYNISPTAGSCRGIKRSVENKMKLFEKLRELTDDQIIEIFNLRNNLKLNNNEISKIVEISPNQISAILTKPEKYQYTKEKYNLKLEIKNEKKFTKEDVILIHHLWEHEKLNINEISKLTGFQSTNLKHLIHNKNIYKIEKEGLIFNIERNRKNKIFKIERRKGIKMNKKILTEEIVFNTFDLKHNLNLTNKEISEKLSITPKELELILTFRYQRRKYNQVYLDLKTKYGLRKRKNTLTEQDIINIFKDYNSGDFLIEDLNLKYNYNDVGILLSNSKKLSNYYREIIINNNLKVDKSLTKNTELKSKYISDRNKLRSKVYKLTDPFGVEFIIKNLSEFCKNTDLDPANFSRISKTGKKYKGWTCQCLQ